MTEVILRTRDLIRRYPMGERYVDALAGVDLTVHRGEFLAIVGVSGSGKSTLLHLIGGLDRPTAGEVWVDDRELGSGSDTELTRHRRQRVGFVFQTFNLVPHLTALENVALPLMFAGIPHRERETRARVLLEEVRLGHRLDHRPTQLSGGEQQRVAIARGLIHHPAILLADEPTGNLDSKMGAEVLTLLRRLNQEQGVTLFLVTHDPQAAAYADRVVHLRDGRVEREPEEARELEGDPSDSPVPPDLLPTGSLQLSDVLRTALGNLGRRVVRSFLTIFGVFVGIITIVAMLSVAVGVEGEISRNIKAVGLETLFVAPTMGEGSPFDPYSEPRPTKPITTEVVEALRQAPGVASVAPQVTLPTYLNLRVKLGGREASTRIEGTHAEMGPFQMSPFQAQPQILAGRELAPGEDHGAVLSARLAQSLGITDYQELVGEEIALVACLPRGEEAEFPVSVVGVDDGRRSLIDLGVADAAAVKAWWYNDPELLESRGYDALVIKAEDVGDVIGIETQVQALGYEVRSLRTLLDMADRVFAVLNTLLGSVGGLALFVAALGVTNTMIVAIYERTREIGIMKAIGASRGDVLKLFMAEAGLIGFLGGVVGLVLGSLLGRGVDWVAHLYLQAQEVTGIGSLSVIPWWLAAGAVAFATLVGLAAGVYPAFQAARLDPVDALRYE